MITTPNVDPSILQRLSDDNLDAIGNYINDPMTATIVTRSKKPGGKKEVITSELLYYYMTAFNIPVEFQKWHLNRLMTLIEVCDAKQDTGKPMSKEEIANRNAALNAERRKKFGSKG